MRPSLVIATRTAARQGSRISVSGCGGVYRLNVARHASSYQKPHSSWVGKMVGLGAVAAIAGVAVYSYPLIIAHEPTEASGPPKAEIVFEKSRKLTGSKEDSRDLLSSQHLQAKKSWENPGVFAWGSNAGKVVAPDSKDAVVKTPRRLSYFDGQILRDLKLDRDFGTAITENGDLVQWGVAFSKETSTPTVTLRGKDLIKIAVSKDRIIALSSAGSVYSIPVSRSDQATGARENGSTWHGLWSSPSSPISYRTVTPRSLGLGEKVVDVSSGQEHCLMLTSKGRVFSAASSTEAFPSKGQLGVPGLTWQTRPQGPYDTPHEVATPRGHPVFKIATGDYHSVILDKGGKVFTFGDNAMGQLGFETDVESSWIDVPTQVAVHQLYRGTSQQPVVTSVAAGGCNTFFVVEAIETAGRNGSSTDVASAHGAGRITADVWACGGGLHGGLGTGKWRHISSRPTKIKSLSGLLEFDEKTNKVVPIRVGTISVGSTHVGAVMDNVTNVDASSRTSNNDTNWGSDVMWWGGNEHYQLGTGKRNNLSTPTHIGPLDGGVSDAEHGRKGEASRLQITPRKTVRLGEGGEGRKVSVEQRIECGRHVTAVYSGA